MGTRAGVSAFKVWGLGIGTRREVLRCSSCAFRSSVSVSDPDTARAAVPSPFTGFAAIDPKRIDGGVRGGLTSPENPNCDSGPNGSGGEAGIGSFVVGSLACVKAGIKRRERELVSLSGLLILVGWGGGGGSFSAFIADVHISCFDMFVARHGLGPGRAWDFWGLVLDRLGFLGEFGESSGFDSGIVWGSRMGLGRLVCGSSSICLVVRGLGISRRGIMLKGQVFAVWILEGVVVIFGEGGGVMGMWGKGTFFFCSRFFGEVGGVSFGGSILFWWVLSSAKKKF